LSGTALCIALSNWPRLAFLSLPLAYFYDYLNLVLLNSVSGLESPYRNNKVNFNPLHPCCLATEKSILEHLFSSALSPFKDYHPSGNLKFNYLGVFQSLKLCILVEKNPSISFDPPPSDAVRKQKKIF